MRAGSKCRQGRRVSLVGPSRSETNQVWFFLLKQFAVVGVLPPCPTSLGRFRPSRCVRIGQRHHFHVGVIIKNDVQAMPVVTLASMPENGGAPLPARRGLRSGHILRLRATST